MSAAVQFSDVTKRYDAPSGVITPVSNLTLRVRAGEITVLLGRSGCGKTTLLRLASGLLSPDAGRVTTEPAEAVSAVVFQDPRLLPWKTAEENVALALLDRPRDEARRRARTALARVGLAGREGSRPSALSGGQAQRVALARALAVDPDILLLDEPFGALDALTREELQNECARLLTTQGMTVLMITHDVREAVRLADRILIQSRGGIVDDIEVTLPRPRSERTEAVISLENAILKRLLSLPY